ncbi:hypothetical protein L1987_05251 [Smallanthus sonchifolius]|uniref:Uncharacterized protein n=1 Tax=Smallanthus sonchifolius TaxID=185202 RepID=A0ACB9JUY7_9ASTR|nr:hypothetical protein L1987_05251 [Smallanthus sonchifolius]
MESSVSSPAPPARGVTGRGRDNSAKTMVTDQITQAVLSTSNLLHIMLQSSPSQNNLVMLPKNLLARASTRKEHSAGLGADALGDIILGCTHGQWVTKYKCVSRLETVTRLLSNIENNQLKPLTDDQPLIDEPKPDTSRPPETDPNSRPESQIETTSVDNKIFISNLQERLT